MVARLLAFLVWGLLAGSGAFWLMKLLVPPVAVPPHAVTAGDAAGPRSDLSRLLGAAPAAELVDAGAESRYRLIGLVAPKQAGGTHAGEGVAVIAVGDTPPRTVRVGAVVDADLKLLAMDGKSASLGSGGVVSLRLQLPEPAAPATGAPPVAVNGANNGAGNGSTRGSIPAASPTPPVSAQPSNPAQVDPSGQPMPPPGQPSSR